MSYYWIRNEIISWVSFAILATLAYRFRRSIFPVTPLWFGVFSFAFAILLRLYAEFVDILEPGTPSYWIDIYTAASAAIVLMYTVTITSSMINELYPSLTFGPRFKLGSRFKRQLAFFEKFISHRNASLLETVGAAALS